MSPQIAHQTLVAATIASIVLMLAACAAGMGQPPGKKASDIREVVIHQPNLDRLQLMEGFNVVDRTPSGLSLAAKVKGNRIMEWRVFDDKGTVVFKQESDDDLSWWDACLISGGEPGFAHRRPVGVLLGGLGLSALFPGREGLRDAV